ncbi:SPOR domain-containing protein [Xanthobacter sp. KR7-65]|uniref:SPOR domain-containing protein n=1 Tax=Xanthobacter sp. KR7-65 TaxID=3156612 RepID=UPI0032B4879A
MVDESRFRYRRNEGAAEGGARPRTAPAAAATGDDPLAELARLIGDDDPFDDFAGLEPEQAPQAADPRRSAAAQRYAPPPAPRPAQPAPQPIAAQPVRQLQPPRPFEPARDAQPYLQPGRTPAPTAAAGYDDEDDDGEWDPRPAQIAPSRAPARMDGVRAAPQQGNYASPPQPLVPAGRPAYAPAPQPAPRAPANDVRTGYGSLARDASRVAPQPAPADDDYDDDEYDDRYPPARHAGQGHAQDKRAARYADDEEDEAAYAFSAARRDDDSYDEYDDAYDPEYADDGYMPPHGEDLYEPEPRRRRGRLALVLGVSVLGLVVAGAAGVFAYNMAIGKSGGGLMSSGAPPVIKADSAPAKTASPTPPADPAPKLSYDRVGGATAANERMVPREEQPVDVTSAARAPAVDPVPSAPQPMQATQNLTEPKKVRTLTVRADGSVTPGVPTSSVSAYAPTQNPVPVGLPQPNPVTTVPAVAPTQTATTSPAATAAGTYVVQVASQRSETDAMGSWKALQTKYPNLLGNYRATVKKADLGDKGIYYRAQVGPFATRDQANELCQSLRAQGGDCVVNKN